MGTDDETVTIAAVPLAAMVDADGPKSRISVVFTGRSMVTFSRFTGSLPERTPEFTPTPAAVGNQTFTTSAAPSNPFIVWA
jgi:hypothetical protein